VPDPGVVWIDAHGDFNTEKTTEPGYLTDLPPGPLFLHLDVDIADPADLPGLQFPAPGGPGRQQLIDAVATLTRTDRIAAVDVGLTWRPDPSAERRRADYMRPILALLGGGMSG
jgi:arginase family enzyme